MKARSFIVKKLLWSKQAVSVYRGNYLLLQMLAEHTSHRILILALAPPPKYISQAHQKRTWQLKSRTFFDNTMRYKNVSNNFDPSENHSSS